jgi:hypothetical protein
MKDTHYLWGLTLREAIIATLFGVLIAISKTIIRLPINIPGHTGLFWMAVLTTGCLYLGKRGSGFLMGIISGMICLILTPGKEGIFVFFKYFLPALSMDIIFWVIPSAFKKWYYLGLIAAFCHCTKLVVNYVSGLILHLPMNFVVLGIKVSIINHIGFGFGAGVLAYLIYYKFLIKHRANLLKE